MAQPKHIKKKTDLPKQDKKNIPVKKNPVNTILSLVVGIFAFLLYANTLNHGFVLDDYSVILENRVTKQGASAIPEILKSSYRYGYYLVDDELYRPIPKALFAVQWSLAPNSPLPGHITNILFYALTGIVLFNFLFRISGSSIFSFLASLLFVTHPLHTEVVANIKSVDEILSFLCCIASCTFILKYVEEKKVTQLFASLLLYFIALMSKESSITFMAVFPLCIFLFAKNGKQNVIKPMAFLLAVALLFLLIRHGVLKDIPHGAPSVTDNLLSAAKTFNTKFATAVIILGMYLKLLFIPHPLAFDYSFNQIPIRGMGDVWFLLSVAVYIGLFIAAIKLFKKQKLLSFGILFYLITLSIYSNIFMMIGSSFGERFLYTPSLGFCICIAALLRFLVKDKLQPSTIAEFFKQNKIPVLLLIPVLCLFSFKTISRNPVWENNYSLFSNDVKICPNSTRTHYYLGNLLVKPEILNGKDSLQQDSILTLAITELEKAVEIYPRFGDALNQLGVAWGKKKNTEKSFYYYQKAVEANPSNPTAHSNLGTVYFTAGKYNEALQEFQRAVQLHPGYAEGNMNLGSCYGMVQDYDNALFYLHKAAKLDPQLAQANYFLGITYRFKGDEANAKFYLNKAHQMEPTKY